jgi:hypothetical protein
MPSHSDDTSSSVRSDSRMSATRDRRPRHAWVLSVLFASTMLGLPGMGTREAEARCRHVAAGSTRRDDADVVLVLPTASRQERREMMNLLRPWARRIRPLEVCYVSLGDIAGDGPVASLAAEDIRRYLRARFTDCPTSTNRPRYLGIFAVPYPAYGDPRVPLSVPTIPRFMVRVANVEPEFTEFETDVPYGFLTPETIDGGDTFVDPIDLDMRTATFTVFRVPIVRVEDLTHFVARANEFAQAPYRHDVALVAGLFGFFPGDTSLVQCINETQLLATGRVGEIFKVFDSPTCDPDFLVTGPDHRLAHFLVGTDDTFRGGMIYDISHGNEDAIYATAAQGTFPNLARADVPTLPAGELNVFVSISCRNDRPIPATNFAMEMYLQNSVAVVSATEDVFPSQDVQPILDAEVGGFMSLYRSPVTILQALHQFRATYYEKYVIAGRPEERQHQWINLLAIHVLGDGLTIVAADGAESR